jgi:hypothetical protein
MGNILCCTSDDRKIMSVPMQKQYQLTCPSPRPTSEMDVTTQASTVEMPKDKA